MKLFRNINSVIKMAQAYLADNDGNADPMEAYQAGYAQAEADYKNAIKEAERKASLPQVIDADPLAPTFDSFWKIYKKSRGKAKCQELWAKLTTPEKMAIMAHVPLYVASTPQIKYRKDPQTYLRNKCWNDQIIEDNDGNANEQERNFLINQADTFARLNASRKSNS